MLYANSEILDVLRLRYWQHLLNEMLKRKQFKIPVHLAFGHEAVAVALDRCIGEDDAVCLSHRNVAYNLIRSKSLDTVLQHYRMEPAEHTPGLMGSMNLSSHASIAYASSILGNNIPVAAGIAMNRKIAARSGIVFVFTGDGAMEEGSFWETLVFSRSHNLGLVIVVENNDYSMSSTIEQRRSGIDLSKVCAGAGVNYHSANGAILADSLAALTSARASAGSGIPACLELEISTFNQHAGPTPGWPDDPLRIALDDGLIVKESPADPLFHIRQMLGEGAFKQAADQVMEADRREKYLH